MRRYYRTAVIFLFLSMAFVSNAFADKGVFNAKITPHETFINTPTVVKITAEIGAENLHISSVNAYLTTKSGQPVALIGQMYDDGTHGDAVPADTIFTVEFSVNQPVEQELYYMVTAAYSADRNRYSSPVLNFTVWSDEPEDINPLDIPIPYGAFVLLDGSPDTFVGRNGLRWSLDGLEFDTQFPEDFILTINGIPVPASNITVEAHLLTVDVTLAEGRNDVSLKVYDTVGRPLYYNQTLWVGDNTVTVFLANPDGTLFTKQTSVVASLADDHSVTAQVDTTTGIAVFTNVPGRTILFEARGIDNEFGTAGILGYQNSATIKMLGFNEPSTIKNHDFSLGTAGWTIPPGTPVEIIPHVEEISGFFGVNNTESISPVLMAQAQAIAAYSIDNYDMWLSTQGEGEKSITYTFQTDPGTVALKLRYRFITTEFPGGWCGSQYNDYFSVSISTANEVISETNNMNDLGCYSGAFNWMGETNWRERTLNVSPGGVFVTVSVAVANVGDGNLNSQVVIDFVEEIKDNIRPTKLVWESEVDTGGLVLSYEVLDKPLIADQPIYFYFAKGKNYNDRFDDAVFHSVSIPANTPTGKHDVKIPGSVIHSAPNETKYIIAVSAASIVVSVKDVDVKDESSGQALLEKTRNIIKKGLRANGRYEGRVASTARTPEDQARAMFDNCYNNELSPGGKLSSHGDGCRKGWDVEGTQRKLYGWGTKASTVLDVFVTETTDKNGNRLTKPEVLKNRDKIIKEMTEAINKLGEENIPKVFKHCADQKVNNVVDVSYYDKPGGKIVLGQPFIDRVKPLVIDILPEPENKCFHLIVKVN